MRFEAARRELAALPAVEFEEMVRITPAGCELVAKFPFEPDLLG